MTRKQCSLGQIMKNNMSGF
uniref:Uncharacterized protein n=1 Tax=Anguilla anguilla TaxID=7936 RepID=A0A0E9RB80_ANGAN